MRRSRAKFSSDELDQEIQNHVTTARRSLGRAVDAVVRAKRDEPRHVNRARYKALMEILTACENVRSTVPAEIDDPDLYPESLKSKVRDIEREVHAARRLMQDARRRLEAAEQAFQSAGMSFAQDELEAMVGTEEELRELIARLESYRGLSPRRGIDREPIRRAKQERPVREAPPQPLQPTVVGPWE